LRALQCRMDQHFFPGVQYEKSCSTKLFKLIRTHMKQSALLSLFNHSNNIGYKHKLWSPSPNFLTLQTSSTFLVHPKIHDRCVPCPQHGGSSSTPPYVFMAQCLIS
jgi:hypothetical protein